MSIYFAFSDENGAYKRLRGSRFCRAHPWYVRSTVLLLADKWKQLERDVRRLKNEFDLPQGKEIKWSYAWSLKSHQRTGKEITDKYQYYFLRDYDPDRLQRFLKRAVRAFVHIEETKVVVTVTDNHICPRIAIERLLRMHLQEAMQRIEMDMQGNSENLCVLFVDPVSRDKDLALREAYAGLYQDGDFIDRYSHIKDSLNLEHSHHSVGIQVADYVAGALGSALNGRPLGSEVYEEFIKGILRRHRSGRVGGFGIREVPGSKELRRRILNSLGESA